MGKKYLGFLFSFLRLGVTRVLIFNDLHLLIVLRLVDKP